MCRTCYSRGLIVYALTGKRPEWEEYQRQWCIYGTQNVVNRDRMLNELEYKQKDKQKGLSRSEVLIQKWSGMYEINSNHELDEKRRFKAKLVKCIDEHYETISKFEKVLHEMLAVRSIMCGCRCCRLNREEYERKEMNKLMNIEY